LWSKVRPIYHQAFAEKGAKPDKIIRNMILKQIGVLHVVEKQDEVLAMALTGKLNVLRALLIDYFAVREDLRGEGIGRVLCTYLKSWSIRSGSFDSLILETEVDCTLESIGRIQFWEKCGFELTDYIHHYIWVPEPYQAMYLKLSPNSTLPAKGAELFTNISQFHKASFKSPNKYDKCNE
jgi:GNAT superfamily N-acetyltransferase